MENETLKPDWEMSRRLPPYKSPTWDDLRFILEHINDSNEGGNISDREPRIHIIPNDRPGIALELPEDKTIQL